MNPHPLIIDCDPGVDDATALLLAFASPELELLGVTTVAGNVGGDRTVRNARVIRRIAGREDVPIHAGCEAPLLRKPVAAGHFHGESGLGTLAVDDPGAPAAEGHAVEFLIRAVTARPERTVTLAVIGPMTNVAMAMRLEPRLAGRLKQIVFMGGARREGGNITPSAEFNVFADPHAAAVVFASGVPLVVMGLDVTHQVRGTPERIAAIEAGGTPPARAAAELLRFSREVASRLMNGEDAPLHDPCTVAWLLRPELFELRPCALEVETLSELTLGHTAVDFRLPDPAAATVRWAARADADAIFALIAERLAR